MPDYTALRMKDLGHETLSDDSVRKNARAKAVRASYEFWSTGNEALLEQAFGEIFAEHAVRPVCEPTTMCDAGLGSSQDRFNRRLSRDAELEP